MNRHVRLQTTFKWIERSAAAILFTALILFILFLSTSASSANKDTVSAPAAATDSALTLVESAMCEQIADGAPQNMAAVFSITVEKVICFTAFDPVPEDTFIYHNWFRKDKLSTKRKLSLKAPRWKTFSSIHLRESDLGPWRVEVTGPKGEILDIMWFSVTE